MNENSEFNLNSRCGEIISSLPEEKQKFIEKHSLLLTDKMLWVTLKENSFPRKICRHEFMEKSDILGLLFRVNEICFAKVNYFRSHISSFEPCKYNYKDGFCTTGVWDTEFFKHKASGYIIDLRYLNSIKEIEKFREFCIFLEEYEQCVSREE
ncbi:MAG TPA: hypothetical protein PKG60_10045 [Spirochaetota bacterium]|nr:hypothetical protein [Spirochaetota bacterium]